MSGGEKFFKETLSRVRQSKYARGAAVRDGRQAERDGKTGTALVFQRAIFADGAVSEVTCLGGGVVGMGGQDKSPIKQIKNNSRNYRPR